MSNRKVPITAIGAERLRVELQRLKTIDRPAIVNAIAEARSHGDITENAEYEAARERQGFIEGRIIELESKLANAQVIDPALLDDDGRVVFGSTVELMDTASEELVSVQRAVDLGHDLVAEPLVADDHDGVQLVRLGAQFAPAGWCQRHRRSISR